MPDFQFPVLKEKASHFPEKAICPWCKSGKVFEPHSFAFLSGGSLLEDPVEGVAGPSDQMEGFLHLGWHGAHEDKGGTGVKPRTQGVVKVVQSVIGGQFELYFCSTSCLRSFLNHCVDELEKKI